MRQRARLVLAIVACWLMVMTALGLGPLDWFERDTAPPTAAAAGVAAKDVRFTQYEDPRDRFTLAIPRSWQRLRSSDPEVALVARADAATDSSVLVRVVPLKHPVNLKRLGAAKARTDALVRGSTVKVFVDRAIKVNGVPGFYYLYTYRDPDTKRLGIHAHYFLFPRKDTMQVLVCQAEPDTEFVRLAPVCDDIARSYRAR